MKLEYIKNASFEELKNEFEGKCLADEQLDELAENENVWYEIIEHGRYEYRDLTTPAGEKQETFGFHYEL